MATRNHNSSAAQTKKTLLLNEGGKDGLTQGKDFLTTSKRSLRIVNQKEMAARLSVSEATISQWLSGAKDIPLPRQLEILKQAKLFLKEQRTIEDNIDALMLMQWGRIDE